MARATHKTAAEMEVIREADGILRQKQAKEFVQEPSVLEPFAYFQVGRYRGGPFHNLFAVAQLVTEDASGKPLKKPISKTLIDGVKMDQCGHAVIEALGIRLNRMVR